MAVVQSVAGPIDTADLGFTLMHEHVVERSPGVAENFPVSDPPVELAMAIDAVRAAQALGVRTIVDQTPSDMRDLAMVQDVVRATGVQVLVATGLYFEVPRYFRSRSADHMAGLFVRDIEVGIMDTGVRAAFLKCATETTVDADVEKVLVAASMAHRATGAPISTHTNASARGGLAQQDVFAREGVDLSRVLIGHCGDTDDLDYLRSVLDRGSYVGMDRFGLTQFLPTDRRVAAVARLCELGYAGQMILSHDHIPVFDWFEPAVLRELVPDWRWTFIPDTVLPALRAAGVSDEQIETMTVDNPRRYFERQGSY